jgi:hypothetical protein
MISPWLRAHWRDTVGRDTFTVITHYRVDNSTGKIVEEKEVQRTLYKSDTF